MSTAIAPTKENFVETLPEGWETEEVTFSHRNGDKETRYEIIHLETGKRYLHEPTKDTALKCFFVFVGSFFYFPLYMTFHAFRAVLTPLKIVGVEVFASLKSPSLYKIRDLAKACLFKAPLNFLKETYACIRAPFYALQMQIFSLYGIVRPLEGRVYISEAERKLHQKEPKQDFRFLSFETTFVDRLIFEELVEEKTSTVFFLAFCMQPLGKVTDPHVISHHKV